MDTENKHEPESFYHIYNVLNNYKHSKELCDKEREAVEKALKFNKSIHDQRLLLINALETFLDCADTNQDELDQSTIDAIELAIKTINKAKEIIKND